MGALCCVGSVACCAGSAACSSICCLCKACGVKPKNFSRLAYVILDLFWILISFALMFSLKPLFDTFPNYLKCNDNSGGGSSCLGASAVIRMSFVLFMFHLIVLIAILPRANCSSNFHDGCWVLKFLLIAAGYVACFFIPNPFYKVWAYIARVLSSLFLIFQAIVIMLAAYSINDAIVGSYNQSKSVSTSRCQAIVLISLTSIISAGTIVLYYFEFAWFHPCGWTIAIIVVTIVLMVISMVLVLLKLREDSSILTSSMVGLYTAYLGWGAMASIDSECNPFQSSNANTMCQIFIGIFVTFFCLIYISTSSQNNDESSKERVKSIMAENIDETKAESLGDVKNARGNQVSAKEAAIFPVSNQTIYFQVMLIFSSLYYAMLMTNWGDPTLESEKQDYYAANKASFWIKISAQWVCMGMYTWSLIAPRVCKGRDFL